MPLQWKHRVLTTGPLGSTRPISETPVFGHLMQRTDSLEKTLILGKIEGEEKRTTEDEMVGSHHQLDGHEFEQALGVRDGQGSLACCSPWGQTQLRD